MSDAVMTREEAIVEIVGTWKQCDGEFCVGDEERAQSDCDMRNALHALGVTDEEIDR